jgi:hypothetical protein
MQTLSTFIDDLKSVKKLYNSGEKPFSAELITKSQRKYWAKIKQCDFCKPTNSELSKSGKEFVPLVLKKSHGFYVVNDDYVFTCSYRTSQDFWRYEDSQIRKFASQYPYIEEIIRLAIFVKMEPIRCIILIIKLCFERYWKRYYPLTESLETVYGKFVSEFQQKNELILHSGIYREQKSTENLNALCETFSTYYPGTNFYYTLSLVLSEGMDLIGCGIADLSVNAFIEKHTGINQTLTFNDQVSEDQDIILETFESVFDILRTLAQNIIEQDGPRNLPPLLNDIEKAREKLNLLYISCIQPKQKGSYPSKKGMLDSERIEIKHNIMLNSGLIDPQIIRLINITGKYDRLVKNLHDNPYLVLNK